jgi:hypothetical protein
MCFMLSRCFLAVAFMSRPGTHSTDWPYSSIHRDIRAGRVDPEWSGVVTEGTFGEP